MDTNEALVTENEELRIEIGLLRDELRKTRQAMSYMSAQGWGEPMTHEEIDDYVQETDEKVRTMVGTNHGTLGNTLRVLRGGE